MFLSRLTEEKKALFLELSIHAAMSNQIIAEEQRKLIEEYCIEMGLVSDQLDIRTSMDLDDVLEKIKLTCSETEVKIVVFEIMGLLVSDLKYDELEKVFVTQMVHKLDVSEAIVEKMLALINDFKKVFDDICDVVLS